MNRFFAAAIAALSIGALAAPAVAATNARQLNQQRNIDAGLRSGKLTRAEANRLRAEQRMIERTASRLEASGGRYTAAEKRRVHAMQDVAGANIDRLKHNRRRS